MQVKTNPGFKQEVDFEKMFDEDFIKTRLLVK